MRQPILDFLSGAVTLTYVVAGAFFLRFWRQTRDRLFRSFGVAFLLLASNQALVSWLGADHENVGFTYILRVLGFTFILYGIVRKNVAKSGTG